MRFSHPIALLTSALLMSIAALARADAEGFADKFDVNPADFGSVGRNDFFILEPGYQCVYEGTEDGKPARLVISVLDETKKVDGVETRVVEERESVDGKLVEVSRNFFAIDKNTNDAYYFGEDVDTFDEGGKVKGHPGSWQSGKDGAHFGLFMPVRPVVGQKFYQEVAPKVAMDRCEVASLSERIDVPAGKFEDCLKTTETTPLEPDNTEHKFYAKGVGLIVDAGLKLVKSGKNVEPRGKQKSAKKPGSGGLPERGDGKDAVVPVDIARDALSLVGTDPEAEVVWERAINDPALSAHTRQDLIEDLNEHGFQDPHHVTADELPIVLNRIALIEQLAPDAMDEVNAAAFAEAYKDLTNIATRLMD